MFLCESYAFLKSAYFIIQVITEELGMNLENFDPEMLGTCKKVLKNAHTSSDHTFLVKILQHNSCPKGLVL